MQPESSTTVWCLFPVGRIYGCQNKGTVGNVTITPVDLLRGLMLSILQF